MKFLAIALVLFVASTSASPQANDINIAPKWGAPLGVEGIKDIISQIQMTLRNIGFDPLRLGIYDHHYNIAPLVDVDVFFQDLLFTGASNIQINNLNYDIILNRYRFDFEIPELDFSFRNGKISANVYGENYFATFGGRKSTQRIRFAGEVYLNSIPLPRISIKSLDVKFSVGAISSDFNLSVMDRDVSSELNNFLNNTIPRLLNQYEEEINEFIAEAIRYVVDKIWG